MMGLQQNYPVTWGAERMEGLTLDLGLDGMFSPLPTDLNVSSKESEPVWRFFGQSQTQQVTDNLDCHPSVPLQSNFGPERKKDIFELSLSYPPLQQQQLINMKVEREDVVPTVMHSLPTDVTSEHQGSNNCWGNGELPHKELHLYGGMGADITSQEFQDTMADFPEIKSQRSASTSAPAAKQAREVIVLDEDDSDDEFFFESQDIDDVTRVSTPSDDRSIGYNRGLQPLPLRQIKQQVRSSRSDEEYSCLTPSCALETTSGHGSKDLEVGERDQLGEQGTTQPKRVRVYGDQDWLPSDLLDASPAEWRSESKRARGNSETNQAYRLPIDMNAEFRESSQQVQVQTQKPVIDMNLAIREMPQDTAEAFKELFMLVGASSALASRAVDEIESRRSVASNFQHPGATPAPPNPPVFAQGPSDPSESASLGLCPPHPIVYEQHADKREANAHVVLYEPKPEPLESWTDNTSGSVVHVKQEMQQYENISDTVSVRPVGETAVGPCLSSRKLILTALDTFEQCRQQILRDPSYGQTSTDGVKSNNRRLRADLKAACLMRKKGFWLNERVRPIGEVAGVSVGMCFRYRIEMAVIGLHRAVQAGIAVVPIEYSPYGVTVASSVVIGVSDPYQDDNDMGDTVVYSGQGGLCGRTKESQDQELKRGNLALSNSYDLNLPVRLIRGRKEQNSKTGILYSYDGLFHITDMRYVNGVNGKKVYKFTMQRLPGQPNIHYGGSYPAPIESHPPAIQQSENAVEWTQSSITETLFLEKRPMA